MNLKKNTDIESTPRFVCPVTGLPILRRPEWTGVNFGKNYRLTVSVLGDRILLCQASGYATLPDIENACNLARKVAKQAVSGDRAYVQMSDFSNLQGSSLEARKYYINCIKKNNRLLGLIFFGTSSIIKLSIKLGKRLNNIVTFDVQIAKDYSDAVKLALKMLSTVKSQPDDSPIPVTPKPLNISQNEDKVCHVTGLPITSKPEWTDIDLGEGYSVTFKFIGDRILLSIPRGKSGKHGMENLMQERSKVRDTMIEPEEPFFEIKDYSGVEARITRTGRDQFSRGMIADKDRIIGFIGYNAPLAVRLSINVGKRLYNPPFPLFAVKDYEEAIKKAVDTLKSKGYGNVTLPPEVITSNGWSIQMNGFSARFEIIDGHIFHADTNGFLQEEHVASLFNMYEKIIRSTPLPKGSYYFVGGVTDVKGSRNAYRLYFNNMMQFYKDHPFRECIYYGANRFLRGAINIAIPFAPFPIKMTKNFNSALRLIVEDKANDIKPASLSTLEDMVNKTHPSNPVSYTHLTLPTN